MRLLLLAAIAMIATPSVAGPFATARPYAKPPGAANCPRTTSHYAGKGAMYRGNRLVPRKLTELPPAVGYMAVYRTVNGCEAPLTIVDYRTGSRP
jgi:hypothetical protein